MPYGMYISAAGAQVQSERLRVLANNLANVDTAGFKREKPCSRRDTRKRLSAATTSPGSSSINDSGGGVQFAETVTDFSKGRLRQTDVTTDLAIDGDGFFLVEKDGEQLLTRAGNFRFNASGRLETQQGHAVLATDGKPVMVDPRLKWRVTESGPSSRVTYGPTLALVSPRSLGDLAKSGVNYFLPLAPVAPVAPAERRVQSGYLEASTVVPSVEMMELIETSRAFEANIRMIQNHDQMLGALVNRVLRTA